MADVVTELDKEKGPSLIKERLAFYERKYRISTEDFYRKYHNSEAIFDGSQEQVLDFLLWESDYERYLELTNGSSGSFLNSV
jgi:hypothetical protein